MMRKRIVIVGAGPAGMAAAISAVEAGCDVTLLDEAMRPGGQIFRQAAPELKTTSFATKVEQRRKSALIGQFGGLGEALRYVPGAQVISAFPGPEIQYVHNGALHTLRPSAVILATGVRERVFPFEGWTLPGVLGAGGAQSILKAQMVLPGKRMVVAGAGPLPLVVAAQMARAGAEVKALAQLHHILTLGQNLGALLAGRASVAEGLGYLATVVARRIPQLTRFVPILAMGGLHLEAVVLAKLDKQGTVIPGSERCIETDILALNYGFVANSELALMLGVEAKHDSFSGWYPRVDDQGRTSDPTVFACGDGAGLRGSHVAQADGRIVGAVAAAQVLSRSVDWDSPVIDWNHRTRAKQLAFQVALRETLKLPEALWDISKPDTIFCRCENVTKDEILDALEHGHRSINAIKRNTRCGMGWCGGRSCLASVEALSTRITGQPSREPMTSRPAARPVSLGEIARVSEGEVGHDR